MTEYYYRRKLDAKDMLPAAGISAVIGLAAFYLVQLLIQRTPLVPSEALARESLPPEPKSGPAGSWDRSPDD